MAEKRTANGRPGEELLITIPGDEASATKQSRPNSPMPTVTGYPTSLPRSFSNSKPPKIPVTGETLVRKRSLTRLAYSKPKSRFGEQPVLVDSSVIDEDNMITTIEEHISRNSSYRYSLNRGSPHNKSNNSIRTNSIKILANDPDGPEPDDDDDVEDVIKKVEIIKEKKRRVGPMFIIQWITFIFLFGCLVASLTVRKLENTMIWRVELWKLIVVVFVTFSGMFITNWFMHLIVFIIERNFLLRKKVLYFVYGLKKSVQVFVWFGLVLLAWIFLVDHEVERSKIATKILDCVTFALISLLIGSFLWVMKTLMLKILASNFHVNTFFDRIQESIFHQYVLQILSGPPLIEEAERVAKSGQLSFRSNNSCRKSKEKKVIDMDKLHKMKQEKVSAGTMKSLIDAVTNSGLCTLSNTLEESVNGTNGQAQETEIHNEMEAIAAAYHIFNNVAKPGWKYIDEEDLLRFMIKEEVELVFPLFEVSENKQIDRKSLTDWVVKVFKGRKALAHALGDTKTAVKQLNKLLTVILIIGTVIIWILLIEVVTKKIIWWILTNLLVASFMMKNTFKNIFESLVFVFVMHPFDVGDRCVVDGVQLLVEEMNILTTVFLKLNNEKVYYPNAVLATKPISNYYRSPDMGDAIDFSIDFATPMEKIGLLKDKIKLYLESNPQHWYPGHAVVVKEIEDVNKLKMALFCNHTMTFQEWGETSNRRTELVLAIKKMLEELEITYYLPPQQIHLRHIGSDAAMLNKI